MRDFVIPLHVESQREAHQTRDVESRPAAVTALHAADGDTRSQEEHQGNCQRYDHQQIARRPQAAVAIGGGESFGMQRLRKIGPSGSERGGEAEGEASGGGERDAIEGHSRVVVGRSAASRGKPR